MTYETLRQKPEIKEEAAEWFHDKWGVPKDAYLQCMETYINKETEYGCNRFKVKMPNPYGDSSMESA